ncbi:MAG: TusE/DsrC/DsvC family sulfur relay protein [Gammaproteobacteria bacterium]|nr:TusE/DsrC/DsvC family sulfur relay protein [Gammaproteobacteria bacterium]
MPITVNNIQIETNENGYLISQEDWSEEVAQALALNQGLTLTERHWDVIHYLREEYFENSGNQPNNRVMGKAMGEKWQEGKVKASVLFDLFPGTPSKQAGLIAGLPESMRKGGY